MIHISKGLLLELAHPAIAGHKPMCGVSADAGQCHEQHIHSFNLELNPYASNAIVHVALLPPTALLSLARELGAPVCSHYTPELE